MFKKIIFLTSLISILTFTEQSEVVNRKVECPKADWPKTLLDNYQEMSDQDQKDLHRLLKMLTDNVSIEQAELFVKELTCQLEQNREAMAENAQTESNTQEKEFIDIDYGSDERQD